MKINFFILMSMSLLFSCSLRNTNKKLNESSTRLEQSVTEEFTSDDLADEALFAEASAAVPEKEQDTINTIQSYSVKKGDTLMLVAFKLYGNYERWREIAQMNQEVLKGSTFLESDTNLKYNYSNTELIKTDGLPYLVKNEDTLGLISKKVYGVHRWWDVVWYNNREHIKNPNHIYAGFVLFYPVKENLKPKREAMLAEGFLKQQDNLRAISSTKK